MEHSKNWAITSVQHYQCPDCGRVAKWADPCRCEYYNADSVEAAAVNHLAMLHQVVAALQEELGTRGTSPVKRGDRNANLCAAALQYLIAHRREDSDFADMGRKLASQYVPNRQNTTP